MDQLPVFLNVKGRRILVIGGGTAAARKAELASRAGASVTVLAPTLDEDLLRLVRERGVEHRSGPPTAADLEGCLLAFAASDDQDMNGRVRTLAAETGVLVNVVDRPDLCDFTMPAILDREGFVVAISSGGDAPLLSRMLKARFETIVPWAYGRLARFAGSWRDRVKQRLPDFDGRRRFWEDIFESTVAELVFAGREADAEREMRSRLDAAARAADAPKRGEVYLVGAGPGDPDLLTFRALRLMQRAEVVLYDRLIGEGILNLVRRDAERIYVGKAPNNHTLPQEEISALMVRLARDGKRVLRLKGGDPFIFGRGGEEIEALAEHDIPFQVVPGVTAASGCASYAGIPLTHRDHAHACVFVTGHGTDDTVSLNWQSLIQPMQTVVVYMGLASLAEIVAGFIAHGGDPGTPAAIVEKGTRPEQRVVVATVGELPERAAAERIGQPALIVIGSVVTLRHELAWYEAPEAPPRAL